MEGVPPMPAETNLPVELVLPAPPTHRVRRRSSSSSRVSAVSSHHALDFQFDVDSTSSDAAAPLYTDYNEQAAFKKGDLDSRRSWKRTLIHIARGGAMPVKSLAVSIIWASLACVITWASSREYGPHKRGECRWWCTPLAIDGDALSYVGFALFLLTSFRVQEAYGRYMEGVRVWTSISGTVTSFAKYVVQAFPASLFHRNDRERMLGFLVAFPVALKRELRGERDLSELKGVLCEQDLGKIQNAASMPTYCLYVLSGYLLKAQKQESKILPQSFIVHLIGWVADLAGAADVCNQIRTLPAPYSYISHLNIFLALWLFFLPFALVESTGWGTILIVAFISYGILGIVANAAELENPFGVDYNDLPLGRMAKQIQDAVAATYFQADQNKRINVVHEVQDQELLSSDDFWLGRTESQEQDKE